MALSSSPSAVNRPIPLEAPTSFSNRTDSVEPALTAK
eukprot:CAMPEP_0117602810 /NCGR_PEP_ID=MMETSP0784-20121206/77787_1 /TAXON_ID=39447 /ORGANISM="" /LENGTH=36 /DNA_ID= /DNA_START= /DNA_END= /DNA_ORIENTATION=